MPGSLDPNGVYIYAEDDTVSPFSTFMNLGESSISAALADVKNSTDARLDVLEQGGGGAVATVKSYAVNGTWNKPAHLLGVRVRAWGAGGAGGGRGGSAGNASVGGGGGGGGYVEAWIPAAALPSSVAVAVGVGGAGVSGGTGGAGGNTTFGSFVTANGGQGGTTVTGPSTGSIGPAAGGGSGTATATVPDYSSVGGQAGAAGYAVLASGVTLGQAGSGGQAGLGGAGGATPAVASAVSYPGQVPGGGGSGIFGNSSSAGAAGANGRVIVEQFFKVV